MTDQLLTFGVEELELEMELFVAQGLLDLGERLAAEAWLDELDRRHEREEAA